MFARLMTSLTRWMAYRLGGLTLQLGFMSETTGLLTIYDMLEKFLPKPRHGGSFLGWKLFACGCCVKCILKVFYMFKMACGNIKQKNLCGSYSVGCKPLLGYSLPRLFKLHAKKNDSLPSISLKQVSFVCSWLSSKGVCSKSGTLQCQH